MNQWETLASDASIKSASEALKANGIDVIVVGSGAEAAKKVLELLPKGAEVMDMTSQTLDAIGVSKEIGESGKFDPMKKKLMSMDRNTQGSEMRKLGSAPDWAVGSVHAVTEDGKVVVASATGSQLPAYAYGAGKVIWVVGTQKLVKNLDEAMKRIHEYVFPLEDARARKVYGMGSNVSKLLIVNKEFAPGRITLIFAKEKLGF